MTSWSHLPIDILGIIFEYGLKGRTPYEKYASYCRIKDIKQCQQTCKSWAVVAQMNLYENVELDTLHQANLFLKTLTNFNLGSLVKTITAHARIIFSNNTQHFLQKISYFCSDLKKLKIVYYSPELHGLPYYSFRVDFWKCIHVERSKGFFSKLQVIESPFEFREHQVMEYYKAVYSLRETLRELTIYVGKVTPIKNLEFFTNVDTLCFQLNQRSDIYTLGQQIKRYPSVKFITIRSMNLSHETDEVYLLKRDTGMSTSVHIFPQIKQLSARLIAFDDRLCSYLMSVFPNLDRLHIVFSRRTLPQSYQMPNNVARRFLSYLMKMSSASVSRLPVEDAEDLLINFQDIDGINIHLVYFCNRSQSTRLPYLRISKKQNDIYLWVNCKKYEQNKLPRIGMIEKSGRKLKSLTLNMNNRDVEFKRGPEIGVPCNEADFYYILLYCPNLKNIHILNTSLPSLSMHVQQKQKRSLHTFILNACAVYDSFFSSLSYHVNYINDLTVRDVNPVQKCFSHKNACIDMPMTRFDSISYIKQQIAPKRIFLKLRKTGDNNARWFVTDSDWFQRCSEQNYEASLGDKYAMSLSIHYAEIRTVKLGIGEINITFKP